VPEFTEYPPGVPCWVDLGSPDVDASKAFYTSLFGWEAHEQGPEAGGYVMFTLRGLTVAGLGPLQGEARPPAWSSYICVADADETIRAVRDAGGMVFIEPFDVLDAGRMAIFADSTGAALSVWQPAMHKGAQLATEPGGFSWNELNTRDPGAAKEFYRAVFGWEAVTHDLGDTAYTEWRLDGRSIGGMIDMTDRVPPQVPPHWMVYFSVGDTDATAAAVKEKGGSVIVGPLDIPPGRFAVVADPQGAHFAVIAPPDQP
jgi:predicted enzyme related to lactoylglutathione lyase